MEKSVRFALPLSLVMKRLILTRLDTLLVSRLKSRRLADRLRKLNLRCLCSVCRYRVETPLSGVHDSLAAQPGPLLQAQRRCQAPAGHRHPGQAHHHDDQREADVPVHPGQDLGQPGSSTTCRDPRNTFYQVKSRLYCSDVIFIVSIVPRRSSIVLCPRVYSDRNSYSCGLNSAL